MAKHELKCVSMFTGAGLLDEGLRQAGLEAGVCYEADTDACRSARLNGFPAEQLWFGPPPRKNGRIKFPPGVPGDIRTFAELPPADVVWGGPPCQPFSMASNPSKPGHAGRLGVKCDKGRLLLDLVAAGVASRARVVLVENVAQAAGPEILKRIAALAPGYEVIVAKFNAMSWLPVVRKRVFLLVVRKPLAAKTKAALEKAEPPADCGLTLRDCIGHLRGLPAYEHEAPGAHQVVAPTPPQAEIMKHLGPGCNWTDVPVRVIRRFGLPCIRMCAACRHEFARNINREPNCPECGARRNRRSTLFRRLSWDDRAHVLVTEPTSNLTFQAHPDGRRLLSVQEYMALQGLRSTYRLCGSNRSKLKQLGNGVPAPAARWIGKVISSVLLGR